MTARSVMSHRLHRIGCAIENGCIIALLSVLLALSAAPIALRNVGLTGAIWLDELLRILVLLMTMAGAVAASRDDNHITIDALARILPLRARLAVRVITDLFTVVVCAVAAWHGARFTLMEAEFGTLALGGAPAWIFQTAIPLGFGCIAWRYATFFAQHLRALISGLVRHGAPE
ncbi:TRAP-type C4-dicarboxylate transport system permease small subunit [Desulfobaculum xiamenense]|uniref:TRAP-type C4-dicarboxylate transport system permease small subunit n=1 Tax=Desulfobaculum xiamenense TaxID=995050 RepID=A0A846QG09_9BACT|nr:TRAP transporter small permease [Desulfobaculum xiamenense]NJB67171.1 TRAP-type C4-dicarboxylate transport system permease small subunit [Desulfobaculum xiamenense]